MRRLFHVLLLSMFVTSLGGCAFFTRSDDAPPAPSAAPAAAPAAAPVVDPHAGHDHP